MYLKQKNNKHSGLSSSYQYIYGCGGRIRTFGLRVMSPTSYLTAPPRDMKTWQRPTLTGRFHPITISAEELNFRVRHGNGCDLFAIVTRFMMTPFNVTMNNISELLIFCKGYFKFFLSHAIFTEEIRRYRQRVIFSPLPVMLLVVYE